MTSAVRSRPVGDRRGSFRSAVGGACLVELRSRLARGCEGEGSGDGHGLGSDVAGARGVRDAVDAAVGPLAGAGPLIDSSAARSVDDGDLVWCAQAVQRAINVLEGARSALAAEASRRRLHARRGEASAAETLINATGVGGALARRVEREAEILDAQPQVAASLGHGAINAEQAALVAAAEVPDEVRRDLCRQARNQTADETRKTVRAAEAAWRRESDAQRQARQRAARSASMWIDPDNGMWHLRAKFDALTGDAINRLLVSAIERNWRSDKDLPESKRRSVQQRAADALAWLITAVGAQGATGADGGAASAGAGQNAGSVSRDSGNVVGQGTGDDIWIVPNPTQMIVLTTLDNLRDGLTGRASAAGANGESPPLARPVSATPDAESADVASRPAMDPLAVPGAAAITENGTVLGAADLRRIACDTQVIPVVMGGPSEVLDVGRAKRTIPPGLRRALIARDQRCVWPGCERAPVHCDGHHIQHWIDEGPTCLDNLALLCHVHHHRLHEYNLVLHPPTGPAPPGDGWTVTPAPPREAAVPASPRERRTPVTDHVRLNR
ncbi:DUF222 domain-containing protein [Candidatus Poriferisodalis sp.]|uniref:HNH endonuclease signature motif containing protein n=1 Tax=Candidatus Poriferisodalis sp. TaxID=3101277 RepID=UPI003B0201C1